jgi:molecular chaperone GrpE
MSQPEIGREAVRVAGVWADDGDPAVEQTIAELEHRWRRAAGDLDDLRGRAGEDLERLRAGERAGTAAEWLPVLDGLERAVERGLCEGVHGVLEQAREVIARLGFPRRDDEGGAFDPALHEAIATDADTGVADGTIVRVVRPGYARLRLALVVVAREPDLAG